MSYHRLLSLIINFFLVTNISLGQSISTLSLVENQEEEGIMFDIQIKQNLTLNGIIIQLQDDDEEFDFNIYYKVGSYTTSITTPGDWTLLANTGTITSDASGAPTTLPLNGASLNMSGGTLYGIYIENVDSGHEDIAMNADATTGTSSATNEFAEIFVGEAVDINDGSFSGIDETNRAFIGMLLFQQSAAIPTLGEWGLSILFLGLIIVGLVQIAQTESIQSIMRNTNN